MVQAMIEISENANQILNIVKAKHNLKGKSEAIERIILDYGTDFLEPELRPEFVSKILSTESQKGIKVATLSDLRKRYA
jgi:hypothetical protein